MSVLIVPDKSQLNQLEERLSLLEEKVGDVRSHCLILEENLLELAECAGSSSTLIETIEHKIHHILEQTPQSLTKSILPGIAPFLRKVLAKTEQNFAADLQSYQARLVYLEQYLDNLDQGLVQQHQQLEQFNAGLVNLEQQLSAIQVSVPNRQVPHAVESYLENLESAVVQQQVHLQEVGEQVVQLRKGMLVLQQNWQVQEEQWESLQQQCHGWVVTLNSQSNELESLGHRYSQLEQQFQHGQGDFRSALSKLERIQVQQQDRLTQLINEGVKRQLKTVQDGLEVQQFSLQHLEKFVENLDRAMVEQVQELEQLKQLPTYLKVLETSVQSGRQHQVELESYLDNLEKAHLAQHVRLNEVDERLLVHQTGLKSIVEQLQGQRVELENTGTAVHQLEKVSFEQHLRLEEVVDQVHLFPEQLLPLQNALQAQNRQFQEIDQYLDNLEKAHVSQHLQLNGLNQQVETVGNVQAQQRKQLQDAHSILEEQQSHLQQMVEHVTQVETTTLREVVEQSRRLEFRLNDPQQRALDIADILPDAIRRSTQQMTAEIASQVNLSQGDGASGDEVLAESMQRPVEICIQQAIRKDVRPFADALFPLIGPTIRRSVAELFKDLLQRINGILGQSLLSQQGISWRLQAWRTGQSFGEIVLSNTLQYRVEQAFLIHRETGLLILHAHLEEIELGDSDAISAMFTAIQDFIRDSFSADKGEELESVEVGQYTVWVERGPYAVLACVIRGESPRSLRTLMREQLETLHSQYGLLLEQFNGDNSKLKYCQSLIEETLRSELKEEAKPQWMTPQLAVILILFSVGILGWGYLYYDEHRRLNGYLDTLRESAGIIITEIKEEQGRWVVYGLRDPLAEDPLQLALHFELSPEDLVFKGKPYQDLAPQFVEHRLRSWLKPPSSVELTLQDQVLYLKGHADQGWIDRLNSSLGLIAGFTGIDTHQLVNTEAQFQEYIKALSETPGILVVSSGVNEQGLFVTGMRDPLAADPEVLALEMRIENVISNWRPYQDLAPQFVLRRAAQFLAPPSTVSLELKEEVLQVRGYASRTWIDSTLNNARTLAGVHEVDVQNLVETDEFLLASGQGYLLPAHNLSITVQEGEMILSGHLDSATYKRVQEQIPLLKKNFQELKRIRRVGLVDVEQELIQLAAQIEGVKIYFFEDIGLVANQEIRLKGVGQAFKQVLEFGAEIKKKVYLRIVGNTDGIGTEFFNEQLSQRRATLIFDWLLAEGIPKEHLGVGTPDKILFGESQPNPEYRNVNFQVLLLGEKE